MVDFVLDDLGGVAAEGFDAGFKVGGLPLHFDSLIPFAFAGVADEGEATFLRFVGVGLFDDFGIEHRHHFSVIVKDDNPF